jgi:hypothetical protein
MNENSSGSGRRIGPTTSICPLPNNSSSPVLGLTLDDGETLDDGLTLGDVLLDGLTDAD